MIQQVEIDVEAEERRERVINAFKEVGEFLGRAVVTYLEQQSPSALLAKNAECRALLTPTDAANYLSLGRSTLYELVKKGEVARVKVGGSTRFRRSDLDRFANRRRK